MLRLMPAGIHRSALRLAHALRRRWWAMRMQEIEGIAILAFDLRGQLLVVRHSYDNGDWSLPTGGMARGEMPEDAARRELFEETACKPNAMQEVGVDIGTLHGAPHRVHVFATKVSEIPRADGREVVEARFFPTHSLPEPLGEATRRRLEMWKAAQVG